MFATRTPAQEAAEDIFFGQIAIVWARWFLIAAIALLALWSAHTAAELTAAVLVVVALMLTNFFVHGRYLAEKPANRYLLMGVNLLDLLIVTSFVLNWQGEGGLDSQFFIFYYPLVFAFALVFPPKATTAYTLIVLALYTAVCFVAQPGFILSVRSVDWFAARAITLAAMGGLGTYYWRIQRDRRRALAGCRAF